MMTVVLSKQDYDDIVAFAKKGLPDEACGLLGGVIKDGQKISSKKSIISGIQTKVRNIFPWM